MSLVVQKYGGTSLATPELICSVARRVVEAKAKWGSVVVVVSAMGDATDELLALAHRVSPHPNPRELDMLMTAGERISMALLSMAIRDLGVEAISFTGSQCGIVTDGEHTNAKIVDIKGERIREALQEGKIVIVAGFQGVSQSREITTLGRGGSDTTAVALAAALKADRCEILKDVDGVCTADPRRIKEARKIEFCSYDEMIELSALGAGVVHPRGVDLARRFEIPLQVGSSFTNERGTEIGFFKGEKKMESVHIRGITHNSALTRVALSHIPEATHVTCHILSPLTQAGIPLHSVAKLSGENGHYTLAFLIQSDQRLKAASELEGIVTRWGGSKDHIHLWDVAMLSIVGEGISSSPEIATKALKILAQAGIAIDMVMTSSLTLSCVIDAKVVDCALQALHDGFNLCGSKRCSAAEICHSEPPRTICDVGNPLNINLPECV